MEKRRFGRLSSSADPEKLSTMVSGAILSLSSLLIWGGSVIGVPLTQNEVAALATQIGLVVGGLAFLYGVVRKIVVAVNARFVS
jgi:hypothetical protein